MEKVMEGNEAVLQKIFDIIGGHRRELMVSGQDLINNGWSGELPNQIFKKFDKFWVRLEKTTRMYKVVRVESWMLSKKQPTDSGDAPLPISGVPKFNLKELYKQKIKDGGDTSEPKNTVV